MEFTKEDIGKEVLVYEGRKTFLGRIVDMGWHGQVMVRPYGYSPPRKAHKVGNVHLTGR